jgi:predicted CXXCH cytochrome family protein
MMTRRATLAGVLALALLLLFCAQAWARGHLGQAVGKEVKIPNPHGGFSVDSDYCAKCHSELHGADSSELTSARTQKSVCMGCHSGQDSSPDGATNILGEYRRADGGISNHSTGHRVLPNSDEGQLQCSDCHSPHLDPAKDPGLLRVQVFNPETGHKIWLYNSKDEPIGNSFCYACHGPKDSTVEEPPPAPFGDFTAFEAGAHSSPVKMQEAAESDEQQAAEDAGTEPAEGTPEDLKQDDQTTGKIVCLFCHAPHDSDYDGVTTADQEALCYQCHTKADPNTADGTSPYRAFNVADNSYGGERADRPLRHKHPPNKAGEQQDGARRVECVSCHNPHFDAATDIGNNAEVANPNHTTAAWPPSATKRGDALAVGAEVGARVGAVGTPSAFDGSVQPVSYGRWARALLTQIEAPGCRDNLVTVVAWEVQEGTAAMWNPLATTYAVQGATSINTSGVKNYTSMGQGLQATRLTLTDSPSSYGYGPVVARLQDCAPAAVTASAINASAWCEGCTNGEYLTAMVDRVAASYRSFASTEVAGASSSFEGSIETVNAFCTACHVAPDVTDPIKKSETVPYGVHLVNDTAVDPGGKPHDLFAARQFEASLHATLACTACHDVHGTSNAYNLREIAASQDGSREAFTGFTGKDNPQDRKLYATFCLSCHADTAGTHAESMLSQGAYCRECHYHGSVQF